MLIFACVFVCVLVFLSLSLSLCVCVCVCVCVCTCVCVCVCVDIRCDSNHFSESGEGSEEKTATLHFCPCAEGHVSVVVTVLCMLN